MFELGVILVVFGVLAWTLLDRLNEIELEAERLQVSLTVRHIRIGIQLAVGEKLMAGEEDRLPELLQASPFDYLGRPPEGDWHYDAAQRRLTYRSKKPEAFDGKEELNWRLEGVWQPNGRMAAVRLAEIQQ